MNSHQRRVARRKVNAEGLQEVEEPKESSVPRHAPKIQEKSPLWRIVLRKAVKLIVFFAGALGFVSAYLSVIPKVSVSQGQSLNLDNPFSTPFIVSNDGPLGINKVDFTCGLLNVSFKNGSGVTNVGTKMNDVGLPVKGMEPGERLTLPCGFPVEQKPDNPIVRAEVVINVEFRNDFTFRRTNRGFRFITQPGIDGKLYWFPEPYIRIKPKEQNFAERN